MSKETIYEEIKSYYKSNLELQDLRLEQDSKMLKEIGKVLNGNAFSEQLESKEPKDYTPFESDVVQLIARLMDMVPDDEVQKAYRKSLNRYSDLLEEFKRG